MTIRLLPRLIGGLFAAACIPLLPIFLTSLQHHKPALEIGIGYMSQIAALYAFPMSIGLGRYPTLREIFAAGAAQQTICLAFVVILWIAAAGAVLALLNLIGRGWPQINVRARRVILSAACLGLIFALVAPMLPPLWPARIEVDAAGRSALPGVYRNFSQGGHIEMRTPGYFEGALAQIAPIRPRLVRIDHVYDYYDVYSINADGKPVYDWSKLDRAVNAIRAIRAEPLICLSYLPVAMSDGDQYGPPKDLGQWEELVYQTVRHFNTERGDGITYWEVWNEPNTGNFWHGSLDDYLALYEATAVGIRRADPTAKIGGPGLFSVEHYGEAFQLINEKSFVDGLVRTVKDKHLPFDFVSWHLYEKYPDAYPPNIERHAAWLVGLSPQPELLLTEWNWSEVPAPEYETGATNAFIAATAAALSDSPLSAAFFFEPIDSESGQWGLMGPDGSPKPAYGAMSLLAALDGERLGIKTTSSELGALAAVKDGGLNILVWNLGERPARANLSVHGLAGSTPAIAVLEKTDGTRTSIDLQVGAGGYGIALMLASHEASWSGSLGSNRPYSASVYSNSYE